MQGIITFLVSYSELYMYSFNREVEVKNYSFVVFRAFLQYIYTDTVVVSPEEAIGKFIQVS